MRVASTWRTWCRERVCVYVCVLRLTLCDWQGWMDGAALGCQVCVWVWVCVCVCVCVCVEGEQGRAQSSLVGLRIRNGNVAVIPLLLAAGADPNKTDSNGATPLDMARMFKRRSCTAILGTEASVCHGKCLSVSANVC
jgi:hypothetical protein